MKTPSNPTLTVHYDEGCGPCTMVARAFDRLNWLGKLWFRPAADYPDGDGSEYADIHSIRSDGRVFVGYEAYQQIAWRVPLFFLFAVLLYIPPVPWIGRRIYRRIADSRECEVTPASEGGPGPA